MRLTFRLGHITDQAAEMTDTTALAARFPADFLFGVATAAYQIEGAARTDGRGASIWDAFAKMPGRVFARHDGDVACDHYHRLESDLDLIQALGVDAYRFSIAWPRILPQGRGAINEKGFDFYERLVDGCRKRGLKTYATLYHWDLPLALAGDGGWTARDTAHAFADYAALVVARLGDQLDSVATFNEPWCSVWLGHLMGVHAPGERSLDAALHALHVTNLAHGLAVQAIRAENQALPTGIVLNPMATLPIDQTPANVAATERGFDFHNGVFFGPIFEGAYPPAFLNALGDRMPVIEAGDMATICQPLDFWGLNYYTPMRLAHAPDADYPAAEAVVPKGVPKTDIGWEIDPSGLAYLIRTLNERYKLPPCTITENGACYNIGVSDGTVADQPRIDYLAAHLSALADLVAEGFAIEGYFAWSLMDNFEWAEGYRMRFGLVHVDYDTQIRTIKESGRWYAALAKAHANRTPAD
jgi:beta-glucosidase